MPIENTATPNMQVATNEELANQASPFRRNYSDEVMNSYWYQMQHGQPSTVTRDYFNPAVSTELQPTDPFASLGTTWNYKGRGNDRAMSDIQGSNFNWEKVRFTAPTKEEAWKQAEQAFVNEMGMFSNPNDLRKYVSIVKAGDGNFRFEHNNGAGDLVKYGVPLALGLMGAGAGFGLGATYGSTAAGLGGLSAGAMQGIAAGGMLGYGAGQNLVGGGVSPYSYYGTNIAGNNAAFGVTPSIESTRWRWW